MEKVVTTPPITVRNEILHSRLLTPMSAGLVADLSGAHLIVSHGTLGNVSATSEDAVAQTLGTINRYIPAVIEQYNDSDASSRKFISEKVEELIERDLLVIAKSNFHICSCGIVCIEDDALNHTQRDKFQNLIFDGEEPLCKHCESQLDLHDEESLLLGHGLFHNIKLSDGNIPQKSYATKSQSVINTAKEMRKCVSRPIHSRTNIPIFEYQNVQFGLDADFTSKLMSLRPLADKLVGELIVCAGARQHERLIGALAIGQSLYPQRKMRILMHSRVQIENPEASLLTQEASNSDGDILLMRLITAAGVSWKNNKSKLSNNDMTMLEKTAQHISNIATHTSGETLELTQSLNCLNPHSVRAALKAIRQGRIEDSFTSNLAHYLSSNTPN